MAARRDEGAWPSACDPACQVEDQRRSDLILLVRNDLGSGTGGSLRSGSSGILHGCGWANAGSFASFPEIKKADDGYH